MNLDSEYWKHVLTEPNSPWAWLALAAVSLVMAAVFKVILRFFSVRLRKITARTQADWDDVFVDLLDGLRGWVLFVWLVFLLSKSLEPTGFVHRMFLIATVAASTYQIALWGLHVIKTWRRNILDERIIADPSSAAALGLLYTLIQAVFLALVVLIGLSNLGVNIGALLAGLGVGGIAVALAAQNILGDLMASLSIVLDKPFVVGDFIITGNQMGTVQNIGVKTTRLRALSGEELIFSNKDLIESRIQNFKSLWQRRVVQGFGVTYSTSADQLEQIPKWVRSFVESHDKLKFDRCHFAKYGASSLDFELVFYVLDPDYTIYMDHQQKLLIDIYRKFDAEGIDFAFPTQTLHIETVRMPTPAERVFDAKE